MEKDENCWHQICSQYQLCVSKLYIEMIPTGSGRASVNEHDIRYPVLRDGKTTPAASNAAFLGVASALPLFAVTVFPLSAIYQIGRGVIRSVLPTPNQPRPDSKYQVDETSLLPRHSRKYDIVLLGATGFTGKLSAQYLAKTYGVGNQVKWAIAGRSKSTMEKLKEELAKELHQDEILKLDTIVVDTSVAASMPGLVRDTRVVITTVGPFSLFGSSVVEFCAKFGTHYVDITGETDWVRAMMEMWEATAQRTGAKLVALCGHDCIPWDLTVMMLADTLKEHKGEDLTAVTVTDEIVAAASGGTIATMLLGMNGKLVNPPKSDPFLRKGNSSHSRRRISSTESSLGCCLVASLLSAENDGKQRLSDS